MPKDPDSPILPHLRPEELSDRDHEESKLGRQLSACWHGDDFDIERSYNVMQGSAELIFDVIYAAFRKRSGYKDEWVSEMVRLAAFRTISTSLGHIQHGIRNLSLSALTETLEETVWNHLEELKSDESKRLLNPLSALPGKQASAYALAGIDIASASPLLVMAANAARGTLPQAPALTIAAPSVSEQLKKLREESRMTVEEIAEGISVRPRSVNRHLSGEDIPRSKTLRAYEGLFSKATGRAIHIKTS